MHDFNSQLRTLLDLALHRLGEYIEIEHGGKQLNAIGFITSDDLVGVEVFLLFEGDLPDDTDPDIEMCPVEWRVNGGSDCFDDFNASFTGAVSGRRETDYEPLVQDIFDLFANAVETMAFRARFGTDLFITFASVDPSDFMVRAEGRFVRRMNSPEIYARWEEWLGVD